MPKPFQISRPKPINVPWLTPLTPWQKFRRNPTKFTSHWLYNRQSLDREFEKNENESHSAVTVVCISDTHCTQPVVPDGDILLHAGDLTNKGSFEELQAQLNWINTLPHKYKIVIGGNHDSLLDPAYVARFPERLHEEPGTSHSDLDWGGIIYLCNTSVTLTMDEGRTISVYGSPWTPQFGTFAFQYPPIREVWPNTIPDDTDIVVTHGPPLGHLDLEGKGCPQLLHEVKRVRPKLVVFGHIHAGRGRDVITYDGFGTAYDGVMTGASGFGAVVLMPAFLARRWVSSCFARLTTLTNKNSNPTLLVNAAVVGGLRNDETHPATSLQL
ncbi:Putative Phosphoesterase [[Torrubiella] hemipterigena]|uniref:Putative Phosphoesterase n=1 Tax=[Torrubiella] hemipterigena TaxID=1531966 RepID=A0A0A1T988_9HYPO|nr:Putative Phosphoesterase [[Torrubiella] hemipterigena]